MCTDPDDIPPIRHMDAACSMAYNRAHNILCLCKDSQQTKKEEIKMESRPIIEEFKKFLHDSIQEMKKDHADD